MKTELTKGQKEIITKMRSNESLYILEENFWGVKFSFLGKTIPFQRALIFLHDTDLFCKYKREGNLHYYQLTDLGKTINL